MAELESASQPTDWTFADRTRFAAQWNDASVFNLLRGAAGSEEYKTIAQRASFYDWFDQFRELQGHDVLWPAAAFIVATQVGNVDNWKKGLMDWARGVADKKQGRVLQAVKEFAYAANQAILDDVFPKLGEIFKCGLQSGPSRGTRPASGTRKRSTTSSSTSRSRSTSGSPRPTPRWRRR